MRLGASPHASCRAEYTELYHRAQCSYGPFSTEKQRTSVVILKKWFYLRQYGYFIVHIQRIMKLYRL